MRPQSPIQSQPFGRTFALAAAVLGAVAVFELGGVTVAFFKNMHGSSANGTEEGAQPPLKIDVAKLVAEVPPPDEPGTLGSDPLGQGGEDRFQGPRLTPLDPGKLQPAGQTPAPTGSTGSPPRPTPVPLSVFTPKVDPKFSELIEQGKLLRNTGDTAGALVKFRAASAMEPGNALPIAEQAFTFEKMSLPDKAAEQWRRIIAMGEGAGVYFSAAKSKLDSAVQTTMRETPGTPSKVASDKQMALGRPEIVEDPDPSFVKKLTLRVPIISRTDRPFSIGDMKVYVLFYDRLGGKDVVRTSANVSNRWSSPPADWRDGDTETLEVSYELPPSPVKGEKREYYGYGVRLYYRGELQDSQAEPAALLQKFPPPATLLN